MSVALTVTVTNQQMVAADIYIGADGLKYEITSEADRTAILSSQDPTIQYGNLTLPTSVTISGNQYKVCGMVSGAFADAIGLTSLVITDAYEIIPEDAFGGCVNLAEVTFSSSVREIHTEAFRNTGMTTISIPATVELVAEEAFYWCRNLSSVTLGCQSISDFAFSGCDNLTTANITATLLKMEGNPFHFVRSIERVDVDKDNPEFCSVDGVVYSKDMKTICIYPMGRLGDRFVLPSSVLAVGYAAFAGCFLSSIQLPDGLATIGNDAFASCHNLTEILLPQQVREIGEWAFTDCHLTKIAIPPLVSEIKAETFFQCEELIDVKLPDNLVSIGNGAFAHCSKLREITIPNSVTTMGCAFYNCENLEAITLGVSVSKLQGGSFEGCVKLQYVDIVPDNPYMVFEDGVIYSKDKTTVYASLCGISSVSLPSSLVTINELAFLGCNRLTQIDIPEGVRIIHSGAFNKCTELRECILPSTLTELGLITDEYGQYVNVFAMDEKLMKIYSRAVVPPAGGIFSGITYNDATLYVPLGSRDAYSSARWWRDFKNIVEMDFSSIDNVGDDERANVKVVDGRIVVTAFDGALVEVYAVNGAVVYRGTPEELLDLAKGIYIICVNDMTTKVVI